MSALIAGAAHAIDLGDASVLSQQGQRLRVAIPYGSMPGEEISVMRFSVLGAIVPAEHLAPALSSFVISKPQRRNVVFIETTGNITAPLLRLTIGLADVAGTRVVYELRIPPFRAAAPEVPEQPPAIIPGRGADAGARKHQAR